MNKNNNAGGRGLNRPLPFIKAAITLVPYYKVNYIV